MYIKNKMICVAQSAMLQRRSMSLKCSLVTVTVSGNWLLVTGTVTVAVKVVYLFKSETQFNYLLQTPMV